MFGVFLYEDGRIQFYFRWHGLMSNCVACHLFIPFWNTMRLFFFFFFLSPKSWLFFNNVGFLFRLRGPHQGGTFHRIDIRLFGAVTNHKEFISHRFPTGTRRKRRKTIHICSANKNILYFQWYDMMYNVMKWNIQLFARENLYIWKGKRTFWPTVVDLQKKR